jgi:hypothetical protein
MNKENRYPYQHLRIKLQILVMEKNSGLLSRMMKVHPQKTKEGHYYDTRADRRKLTTNTHFAVTFIPKKE